MYRRRSLAGIKWVFPQAVKVLRRRSLTGRGLLRAKRREKLSVQSHCAVFGLFRGKEIALCLEKMSRD